MSRRVPSANARKSWLSVSSLSFEVQPSGCTLTSFDQFCKACSPLRCVTAELSLIGAPAGRFAAGLADLPVGAFAFETARRTALLGDGQIRTGIGAAFQLTRAHLLTQAPSSTGPALRPRARTGSGVPPGVNRVTIPYDGGEGCESDAGATSPPSRNFIESMNSCALGSHSSRSIGVPAQT